MTANKRDFQQEFKDNVNALGIPESLFAETPLSVDDLAGLIEPFLLNIPITNEQFTLATHEALLTKDFNLETISKMLNFLVAQTATGLNLTHEVFVKLQKDLRKVIVNYNAIIAPVKADIEREAKLYEAKMNPPGARK